MTIVAAILDIALAALFLFSGGRKLVGSTEVAAEAAHLSIVPGWYRAIGITEVGGAAGLLAGLAWAPIGIVAAAGLALLMLGAVVTHVRAGDRFVSWAPALAIAGVTAAFLAVQAIML